MIVSSRSPASPTLNRRHLLSGAALGATALALGGCGGLFKAATTTPNLYALTPKNTFAPGPTVNWQLVVEEPLASRALDTDYIALMPSTTEIKYFDNARWAERAPRMVQTLLVESFENSGRIIAVGRQAVGLRADFNVISELREFQAEYKQGMSALPTVHVRLNAKLIVQPQQIIVASRTFDVEQPVAVNKMPEIITAFDDALGRTMKQLVEWVLSQNNPNQGRQL